LIFGFKKLSMAEPSQKSFLCLGMRDMPTEYAQKTIENTKNVLNANVRDFRRLRALERVYQCSVTTLDQMPAYEGTINHIELSWNTARGLKDLARIGTQNRL